MEELVRNKVLVIEIGGKEYKLGYPTRASVKNAEAKGLNVMDNLNKLVSMIDKLFYTGLLAYHSDIDERKAEKLLEQYISEGGDAEEISSFLSEQYMAFIKSPDGKKKKKAKIIQI